MQWTRTVTDSDVVESVRRYERNRRKLAAFLVLVGVISTSAGAAAVVWIEREWQSTADALKGAPDASISTAVDGTTFYVGVRTGWLCGLLFTCGVLAVAHGIGIVAWRDRQNRLLLECWDRHTITE
ncbi:hypothetical protein Pan44_28220 [Caulifigura coniformis]|uniref:Uncharacterized protein n=2 Tax=Caulifigura coniformis TaxID=2527983 RepID=A0A517SF68_9PLAN|nr:hypothetical protein Pan44_28220 [Caulifigura coniformis]